MKNYTLSMMIFLIYLLLISSNANSQEASHFQSRYIGQEARAIKSLSTNDIKALENGKGWGLAKAAELNGVPGPKHILEMKKEIQLSPKQFKKITNLFDEMKSLAIPLGRKIIKLEKELNSSFVNRSIDSKSLRSILGKIADTRKELRFVHLEAHLKSLPVLSKDQLTLYNQLRGYSKQGDPCKNIPKGHNAEMWKRHHNCN